MNWIRKLHCPGWIFPLLAGALCAKAQAPAIIPLPRTMTVEPGSFVLRAERTKILVSTGAEETGRYLAGELRRRASVQPEVVAKAEAQEKGNIVLKLEAANPSSGSEGYALNVTPETVIIRAGASAGLFYGVQ